MIDSLKAGESPVVIFDLDGTLANTSAGILASIRYSLESSLICPCPSLDVDLIGPSLGPLYEILLPDRSPRQRQDVINIFKEHYDLTGWRSTSLYPGVRSLLLSLQARSVRLFVATNKRFVPSESILSDHQLLHLFEDVYCSDIPAIALDKAEVLCRLLDDHSLQPSKCLFVGDRSSDLTAASAVGLRFCWASWGYGQGDLNTLGHSNEFSVASSPQEVVLYLP